MGEIKSHEFDGFLRNGARSIRIFVIYGPDRGLVSERAAQIASTTGITLDDPFAVIKLDAGDVARDAARLMDEVNALGLFGGERLVWVRGAANEKPLADTIAVLAAAPPAGSTVIVEAGDLKKGSALRKAAEGGRGAVAIPCYADDGRALNALIDQELAGENLRISPSARQRLAEAIGGDRLASRNEVRKLALYCHGRDMVEDDDITSIVGDASAISVDDAVDALLKGDKDAFIHAMHKIVASKTPVFLVLQACLRQFQLLDLMRAEMDEKRAQPPQVIATLGRHLHFRRKPVIEKALRGWDGVAIRREMSKLQAAVLQSRRRQSLEDTVAMQTLLSTVLQSARR